MCLLRIEGKEEHPFYPDFIVIGKDEGGYTLGILEPHRANEADNYSKAMAMVDYASKESHVDRIELIRVKDDRVLRLNFRDANIVDDMKHVSSNDQLTDLFSRYN